jgi:hypothetical protein
MSRIIAMMPVRNEAWILNRTLQTLSEIADVIIVADQGSTDGTTDILRRFPKVVLTENPYVTHTTLIRARLLDIARQYDGENLLLFTDADEIVSANVLDDGTLRELRELRPGTAIEVELVNLWRGTTTWRDDGSPWAGRWMQIAFRDDRQVGYGDPEHAADHNPRVPACRMHRRVEELKLLHFQFVIFERMLAKQRWYRALETYERGVEHADQINLYYCRTSDERSLQVTPVRAKWFKGWTDRGVELDHFDRSGLYWQELEVLRFFGERGPSYFSGIDIWDVDWEQRRQAAIALGWPHVPHKPIIDPRSLEQRLSHAYLQRFFRIAPWRDPKEIWRLPVLGVRSALRAAGIRRRRRPIGSSGVGVAAPP